LAHDDTQKALEWIPYDRFYNIVYIEKIGVYKANWIDGNIGYWDNENQNWKRFDQNVCVSLKRLNNPRNITLEFMDKVLFKKILKIIIFKKLFLLIQYVIFVD
jgi:hypothetical protein